MRIHPDLRRFWPQLLFLMLAVLWFYRARYFTFYGLGIYSFIDIFLVLLITLLVLRFIFKQAWQPAWRGAWIAGCLLTLFHLGFNVVAKYRPTYDINIHPDAEGCIYLFVSTLTEDDAPFEVDANGIGYIPRGGRYDVQFNYRGEDITEFWEHSQVQQITMYNQDSTQKTAISLQCFDLKVDSTYIGRNPYAFLGCMDEGLLNDYIEINWVEPALLFKQVWSKRGALYDWEYDHKLSSTHPN